MVIIFHSGLLARLVNKKTHMKTLVTIVVGAFVLTGCSSTLTVGPEANEASYFGADASTQGASVTVPLVKASLKATPSENKKKK